MTNNRNNKFSFIVKYRNLNIGKIMLGLFSGGIFTFLVLPSIIAVPMSFTNSTFLVFPPQGFSLQWYQKFLTDAYWFEPTIFSLKVASFTTVFSLILGTMASLSLVRGSLPGKKFFNLLFISPIMVPVIILAFAAYGVYAKFHLIGTLLGMILAHSIICIPFVILVVSANLYQFNISLEMAARSLGATAIKTFTTITLPIIRPAIISAGVFCFIISLDDLVLAMFLVGTKKTTLTIRIFSQIKYSIDPVVAAASSVFIFSALLVIIILPFLDKGNRVKERNVNAIEFKE